MTDQPTYSQAILRSAGIALAGVLVLCSSAALAAPNDIWITTKVKLALVRTDGITNPTGINVDTVNRQVTLHGNVRTAPEKEKAERAAKAVDGVRGVRNLLTVPEEGAGAKAEQPQNSQASKDADDAIARDLALALQNEDSLGDSNVSIEKVHNGVVTLQGTARTLTDQLTAVQIAGRFPGVRRVESRIESPDTLSEPDVWRERPMPAGNVGKAPAAGHVENRVAANAVRDPATGESINPNVNIDNTGASSSYGKADDPVENEAKVKAIEEQNRREPESRSTAAGDAPSAAPSADDSVQASAGPKRRSGAAGDLYLTSMVKMRLLANDKAPAMDINVDSQDGVVTLFGMVADEKEKQVAETESRGVDGVREVKNELQVVADAKREAVEARDDEIATNLMKSMGERVALKNVEVDVKNCVARLSGTVPSGIERLEAMQVARSTRGVCSVKNDLHVPN